MWFGTLQHRPIREANACFAPDLRSAYPTASAFIRVHPLVPKGSQLYLGAAQFVRVSSVLTVALSK